MISRFFIDRPIFAAVLSIVITLAGGVALFTLPLALYPHIAPPTVNVSCTYPGASAQVVSESVATPIEQQVNGVEDMLYMSSQCTNDGMYSLTVTFRHGVDLNMAQVLVQNRVGLAIPLLPDVIKQTGVTTRKKAPDILLVLAITSPDQSYDQLYLSNFALMHLKDEVARVPGVSDVSMLGQRDYSMRIWLDPEQLAARDMTAGDVAQAVRRENMQVATGQIGQPPVASGQMIQVPISTHGRLVEVEEFERIIVKKSVDGRVVRLRDVARVELGSKNEDLSCSVNGKPAMSMAVFQLPDANALATADLVKAKVKELSVEFPPGVDYEIRYDTTPFIRESIEEVFKTLREAVILVAIVVLLFLQNWRSAIIPLVAVPVAIIGTFAVLAPLGFGLNNLTLFGLVLAIGIVVDDAIVVVEAVEHHVEHGMTPRDATIRAMDEVSRPVVAIGLVLTAVFVPCAFITGIVGQFFRQFALTIATSTLISAFNSLTLSPALAALLIRPKDRARPEALPRLAYALAGAWAASVFLTPWVAARMNPGRLPEWAPVAVAGLAGAAGGWVVGWVLDRILVWFFGVFNAGFEAATNAYTWVVGLMLKGSVAVLLIYGGLLYLTYYAFDRTPTGFIPSQDKGYLLVNVQLPDSTSVETTQRVMHRVEEIALKAEGVKHTVALSGQSILLNANAPNFGAMYVMLEDFHHRNKPELHGPAIAERLQGALQHEILDGLVNVFGAPPVEGLGTAGGFKVVIEDRGDNGLEALQSAAEKVVSEGGADPSLAGLFTSFRANTPWLYLDIDRDKVNAMDVAMDEVFNTLQVYLGSLYVNDFNRFGRTWQVNVQGASNFRQQIEDLKLLKIRNRRGGMAPFGAMAAVRPVSGPVLIMRYNMYPSAAVNGSPGPGTSSGQAIDAMTGLVKRDIPSSMRSEWTELAFLQLETGTTAMYVFVLAVVLVFLVLAAQYESWSLPFSVILVVPMCLLCSVAGVLMARMDINIFTQIGFIVLVGLACKNAILIVEFAKARREEGVSGYQATLDACKLRLRPIMMTSLAFILGVVPLALSEGAGAEMRRALGTAVFAGMLGVTMFGIFLTPVFYYVIQGFNNLISRSRRRRDPAPVPPDALFHDELEMHEDSGEVKVKPAYSGA